MGSFGQTSLKQKSQANEPLSGKHGHDKLDLFLRLYGRT